MEHIWTSGPKQADKR